MPEPTVRAGVVGLGMMGSGIAMSLDAAGLLGAAFDVQPAVFETFPQLAERARPSAAATGNLLTTIGADDATYARIAPCLDAISVRAIHAGSLGAGMKLKLVKNALSFMSMCAVHEALLLGEELGFSSALVKEVAADSNLVDHFFWFPMGRPSARPYGDDVDPKMLGANRHFAELARKDVAAAAAAADSVGMDHPVMDLTIAQASRYFLLPES